MSTRELITYGPNSLTVRELVGALFRHKLLAFLTFLCVATGAVTATLLLPNEYEARLKILVKNARSEVPITPEPTVGTVGSASGSEVSENQINSEIELLTSKDLLNQVVKECGLMRTAPSLLERLGVKQMPSTEASKIEEASNGLAKDLNVEAAKKTNIIIVKYSAGSPERAAAVLRRLQELYLDKHLKLHRTAGTYDFFKAQADGYEQQLREAEKRLSSFQQSMNVVSLAQQKQETVQKLTEARSKLLETEAFLREVNDRIERVQQELKTVQPRIVTQSRALPNQYSAERLNTMLVELQNRRTQLLTKFRPDDRLVREVDQQIKTVLAALDRANKQTATEQATDLNPLRQTLESELAKARVDQAGSRGRRESLAAQVKEYEAQVARLEGITSDYDDLARQKKQAEDNYELYTKKQEEARIADELDQSKITNVSIAETPVMPQLPSKPNRPLNLLLGVLLALVLSVVSVFIAEFTRETVTTPAELEALTGLPVLAALPRTRTPRQVLIMQKNRLLTAGEPDIEWVSGE